MSLQIIHSTAGVPEYVLLPIQAYERLRPNIETFSTKKEDEYLPFVLEHYVQNPIALARIKAALTQEELAKVMDVSQAYISKIERQKTVTPKLLNKVKKALEKWGKRP